MKSKTMNEWYREIGKRLFCIREANKLTQEQMAEKLNIPSTRRYQNIEYGESRIAIEQIARLEKEFRVSSEYILFGKVISDKDYEYDFFNRTEVEQFVLFLDIAKKVFKVSTEELRIRMKNYCDNLLQGDNEENAVNVQADINYRR